MSVDVLAVASLLYLFCYSTKTKHINIAMYITVYIIMLTLQELSWQYYNKLIINIFFLCITPVVQRPQFEKLCITDLMQLPLSELFG